MSNLILGKFALENLYYSTLPEGVDRMPSKRNSLLGREIKIPHFESSCRVEKMISQGYCQWKKSKTLV
jgi:hypothetical protein